MTTTFSPPSRTLTLTQEEVTQEVGVLKLRLESQPDLAAEAFLEEFKSQDPKDEVHTLRVRVHYIQDKFKNVSKEFHRLQKIDPNIHQFRSQWESYSEVLYTHPPN